MIFKFCSNFTQNLNIKKKSGKMSDSSGPQIIWSQSIESNTPSFVSTIDTITPPSPIIYGAYNSDIVIGNNSLSTSASALFQSTYNNNGYSTSASNIAGLSTTGITSTYQVLDSSTTNSNAYLSGGFTGTLTVANNTNLKFNSDNGNALISQIHNSGSLAWANQIMGSNDNRVTYSRNGNGVYAMINHASDAKITQLSGKVTQITGTGTTITMMDNNSDIKWVSNIPATGYVMGNMIASTAYNCPISAGIFQGSITSNGDKITNTGRFNSWIALHIPEGAISRIYAPVKLLTYKSYYNINSLAPTDTATCNKVGKKSKNISTLVTGVVYGKACIILDDGTEKTINFKSPTILTGEVKLSGSSNAVRWKYYNWATADYPTNESGNLGDFYPTVVKSRDGNVYSLFYYGKNISVSGDTLGFTLGNNSQTTANLAVISYTNVGELRWSASYLNSATHPSEPATPADVGIYVATNTPNGGNTFLTTVMKIV